MRRAALLLALVFGPAACADEGPNFTVNYALGFTKEGAAMSVFGVYHDGRMDPEAWDELAPKFSTALHKNNCESAMSVELRASKSSLYTAVDDVVRSDGITDTLLDRFAPAATGDSILVIVISGHMPKSKDGVPVSQVETTQGRMGGGGGGRRGSARPRGGAEKKEPAKDVFEMSASVYSKRMHQSAAMVTMAYTGASSEEAITKFVNKFAAAFPGATTCAGWEKDKYLDADTIRTIRQ